MDTQLVMLGTGHAMVTKCYNTCFALQSNEEYFLVDAGGGNGILAQIEKAEISYTDIHHMFVTHGHTDHVLGVVWIIRKISMLMVNKKYQGQFTIYCHDELVKIITTFCRLVLPQNLLQLIGSRIEIREIIDGECTKVLDLDLQFFDIASTKAKQFGFTAVLPDKKKLVCLGDEPYNDKVSQEYVEKYDWMLSEAYCLYEDKDIFKPYAKHHSTALDAGKLAERFGIKNLVLYHTEDTNLVERKIRYAKEAKSVFGGEVYVPDDLEKIKL